MTVEDLDITADDLDQFHALVDILLERHKQNKKWQPILLEEFGEMSQEVNRYYFGGKDLVEYRKELVQVAAVALAMLECLERNGQ